MADYFFLRTFAPTNERNTLSNGALAQLVEHRTENPCVPGSIPGGTTPPFIMNPVKTSVRAGFFYYLPVPSIDIFLFHPLSIFARFYTIDLFETLTKIASSLKTYHQRYLTD